MQSTATTYIGGGGDDDPLSTRVLVSVGTLVDGCSSICDGVRQRFWGIPVARPVV
jgi:hypothetical protein